MAIQFKKAEKINAKLRLGLAGPAGSGKTRTALEVAKNLVPGGRIAFVDTERGSASKYSDLYDFDVVELESFHPHTCVEAIKAAEEAGYDIVIIDSLSHFWMGKDGELEQVDRIAKRSNSGNTFSAWRDVTPMHHKLVDAIMGSKSHVIVTLRVKTEWVIETNERGKQQPRKIGLAPVMKDGVEYEMDVFGDLTANNDLIITKSRCDALSGETFHKAGANIAAILRDWLKGEKPAEQPKPAQQPAQQQSVAQAEEPKQPASVQQPQAQRSEEDQLAVLVGKVKGRCKYLKDHFAELGQQKYGTILREAGVNGFAEIKTVDKANELINALGAGIKELEAAKKADDAAAGAAA